MCLPYDGFDANEADELISPNDPGPTTVIPCRIQVMPDDQTFHLDGGSPASSLIVRDRRGLPADLVAWLGDQPGNWWLREGDETPILGARQLAGAEMTAAPLPIYPTPAAWVASGGDGVVVLSWGANLIHLFDGLTLDVGHLPLDVALQLANRLRSNFQAHEPQIIGLGGEDE